jgi:predicted nucleic acid-binding Zn ribbon protein
MPVYVYKNLTTGATFELAQRITEDALSVDPVTGEPVKRLIQPVGIAFKGSGFYVTDSRKKSSAGSPAKSSDKGSAAASTGTDAKGGEAPSGTSSASESKGGDAKRNDSKPVSSASTSGD